jgi:hypothetical protein
MYAVFSTENKIEQFLRREDTTIMWLSALAELRNIKGASQSRLSAMQRGKALIGETESDLRRLVVELEALRDAAKPLPIRFNNAQDINDLLNAQSLGALQIAITHKVVRDAFIIHYGGGSFCGRLKPSDIDEPVVMTKMVADKVVERLMGAGYDGVTARQADMDAEVIADVSKVWR